MAHDRAHTGCFLAFTRKNNQRIHRSLEHHGKPATHWELAAAPRHGAVKSKAVLFGKDVLFSCKVPEEGMQTTALSNSSMQLGSYREHTEAKVSL